MNTPITSSLQMIKTVFGIVLGITLTACFDNTSDHNRTGYFGGDYSRIYVPDSIRERYDMNQRFEICEKWMAADPVVTYSDLYNDLESYFVFTDWNLRIRDLFTNALVDNVYDPHDTVDKNKFGLYVVNRFRSNRALLLFYRGEFTVFNCDDYPNVLCKIVCYFEKHKDLDDRLLPLCIQEATRLYVSNCLMFRQGGPWRHWMGDQADSLGRIYNRYLYY